MTGGKVSRGHPLFALLAVLGGWVGGRTAAWTPPATTAPHAAVAAARAAETPGFVFDQRAGPQSLAGMDRDHAYAPMPAAPAGQRGGAPYLSYIVAPATAEAGWYGARSGLAQGRSASSAPPHLRGDFAFAEPLPRFYAPEPAGMAHAGDRTERGQAAPTRPRRWSADAWALLRQDRAGTPASPGVLPATYGASQAGAVLRYRLMLGSALRPTLYMRTTSSMGLSSETAAALGFSARPLPSLPVVAAVEGRVTDQGGSRRFQPAVMAVTELAPFPLPAGFRAETYLQGGYVAGRFATPFVDGQLRADRALAARGKVRARLGAGVWGGAQKGAARLDAGPSASITMPLGKGTSGRVALDWRFRLAGDAAPNSGPAVTLSAGF